MNVYPIESGNFKLDGGGMFGVVPKSIWNKTNPADHNNMIDIAARCLLIEDGKRLILVDTGMGNKQSEKFFNYYYRWGDFTLEKSLAKYGFSTDDITDVFLTHLHFDHCGGCIQWNKNQTGYEPVFKNAKFWTNQKHWQWAIEPNSREIASFRKENLEPIQASGQLHFIQDIKPYFSEKSELGLGIYFMDGHTEKQMLPQFQYQNKTFVYVADLIPTVGHLPVPYVMGYDTRPLLTLSEKERFLNEAAQNKYYLIMGHDAHHQIITVCQTEKGVRLHEHFLFDDIFNK